MKKQNSQLGFTLVEIVVAVAIFTVLSIGVIALVNTVFLGSIKQGTSLANADQTRKLAKNITQELRNAVSGSDGAFALANTGSQDLMFYSNVDGGTDIERVHYYLSGGKMYRGILKQSGNPPAYTGSETARVVQDFVANSGSTPLFYYYNNSYDDITDTPLTQPVNIAQVSYIKLNVQVYKKTGLSNSTSYFTVNTGAALRSLKTNLGN